MTERYDVEKANLAVYYSQDLVNLKLELGAALNEIDRLRAALHTIVSLSPADKGACDVARQALAEGAQ